MHAHPPPFLIVGAGLAGCECAHALARHGIPSILFEMKPRRFSPAHTSCDLGELVCSNSLRSNEPDSAIGLLKQEMRRLGSLILEAADTASVPAGKALAVDRELFSRNITEHIGQEGAVTLIRREITAIDELKAAYGDAGIIIAAGPMASESLTRDIAVRVGHESLYFYDAIAPIISAPSVNMDVAFWGSRYRPEDTDYLNCPLNREEYLAFRNQLLCADRAAARDFEKEIHFEGCMPLEVLAERGEMTLAFGPLKPVGFIDPHTGKRPFALLQLRAENNNKSCFNLVGCQTKLTHAAQQTVFRTIPGLENAEFIRFGSMHRNTFVHAPKVLRPDLALQSDANIYLAGQITGVEGYVESAACGLWLGLSLAARRKGYSLPCPPETSALGALLRHLQRDAHNFQPSNVQFGLMPELGIKAGKASRKALYAERGRAAFTAWIEEHAAFLQQAV